MDNKLGIIVHGSSAFKPSPVGRGGSKQKCTVCGGILGQASYQAECHEREAPAIEPAIARRQPRDVQQDPRVRQNRRYSRSA